MQLKASAQLAIWDLRYATAGVLQRTANDDDDNGDGDGRGGGGDGDGDGDGAAKRVAGATEGAGEKEGSEGGLPTPLHPGFVIHHRPAETLFQVWFGRTPREDR